MSHILVAGGKTPVFEILKRGGRVYTKIIKDAQSSTLMPIIKQKIKPNSIVYSDCWKAYNASDVSEFKYYRINHSNLFANQKITSMGLRIFKTKPSAIYGNLMGFLNVILSCF